MQPTFIRGITATWAADLNGSRFSRETFERTLRLFGAGKLRIPLLWGHDFDRPIGDVLELCLVKSGLECTAVITTDAQQLEQFAGGSLTGPWGLSIGINYAPSDCERRGTENHIADGIVREVSAGVLAQTANQAAGPAQMFDREARSMLQPLPTMGHAAMPTMCEHCATGLSAAIARPQHAAFDQVWHCPHHQTTVQANVAQGRVTGWHFLAPVTAEQHAAMIRDKQQRGTS